jgi:hypothetical protein
MGGCACGWQQGIWYQVGEDVIGGECDDLAPTPKHLAEQVVGIKHVGEVGTLFLEVEHGR